MERGEPSLEVDVCLKRPGYEPHRGRPGPELTGCPFLGIDHGRMLGQSEIAVGVHSQEISSLPGKPITRAQTATGCQNLGDDRLFALLGARGTQSRHLVGEGGVQSVMCHVSGLARRSAAMRSEALSMVRP